MRRAMNVLKERRSSNGYAGHNEGKDDFDT
jgi:hypothetical protein